MDKELIKTLGAEWTALDDSYDAEIQALIDAADAISADKLAELKILQDQLFDLEEKLFEALQQY
jgi:hypothetical protein